jgi:hypothetical protein
MSDPWINHDRHRTCVEPSAAVVINKKRAKDYPTMQRVRELFVLEDGVLKRRKPHHRERADRVAGWINPMLGNRYVRVDDLQCKVERLIRIYKGEE